MAKASPFTTGKSINPSPLQGRNRSAPLIEAANIAYFEARKTNQQQIPEEGHPPVPMGQVIAHELEIMGSHGMQAFRYDEMLRMIEQSLLQPQRLIQQKLTLEEAGDELVRMNEFRDAGIKVITDF